MDILSFFFGGFIASLAISAGFYFLGIKRDIKKENEERLEREKKFAKDILQKMDELGLQISFIPTKDEYSKKEVEQLLNNKLNEIISRRNIQLKQCLEDIFTQK